MNTTAKLAFYNVRRRENDNARIAFETGFSSSHVSNVLSGRRRNSSIVNEAYQISFRRKNNSKLVNA